MWHDLVEDSCDEVREFPETKLDQDHDMCWFRWTCWETCLQLRAKMYTWTQWDQFHKQPLQRLYLNSSGSLGNNVTSCAMNSTIQNKMIHSNNPEQVKQQWPKHAKTCWKKSEEFALRTIPRISDFELLHTWSLAVLNIKKTLKHVTRQLGHHHWSLGKQPAIRILWQVCTATEEDFWSGTVQVVQLLYSCP